MVKIGVCIQCKSNSCCDFKDGVELYEFMKSYIKQYLYESQLEIDITTCKCLEACNGPVVKVNDKVFTKVNKRSALKILEDLTKVK